MRIRRRRNPNAKKPTPEQEELFLEAERLRIQSHVQVRGVGHYLSSSEYAGGSELEEVLKILTAAVGKRKRADEIEAQAWQEPAEEQQISEGAPLS